MTFSAEQSSDDPSIVVVTGELDVATVGDLREVGLKALTAGGPDLVIDASGLDFTDSTGLGCLVALHKRAAEAGGSLVLRGVNDRLRRLLDMVSLTTVFRVE
jgi:anti-sigma B factor antagonist